MGDGDFEALLLAANETMDAVVLGDTDWTDVPGNLKTITHAYDAGNKSKEQTLATFNKFFDVIKQGAVPEMSAVEDAIVSAKDAAERAEMLRTDSANLASLAERIHTGALEFVERLEAVRTQVAAAGG